MKPADVGLSPGMPYFRSTEFRGPPPITYLHLYECPKFSVPPIYSPWFSSL